MVESMAKSAPAFGMIGTLIGLVFMMISMNPKTPTPSQVWLWDGGSVVDDVVCGDVRQHDL